MKLHKIMTAGLLAGLFATTATAQTQTQMNLDAGAAFHRADAGLNRVYDRLMASGGSGYDLQLRLAERAWLRFRDAECDWETSGSEGGTIRPMVEAQCLERLTIRRTADLRAMLHCPEGDAGCTAPSETR